MAMSQPDPASCRASSNTRTPATSPGESGGNEPSSCIANGLTPSQWGLTTAPTGSEEDDATSESALEELSEQVRSGPPDMVNPHQHGDGMQRTGQ